MTITLVGGSGFVGTRLIELLSQTHNKLRNIDKQQSSSYPDITTVANILDKKKMISLLTGTDIVVLLAAEHRDDVTPVSLYYDVNVQGMRNILEAMEANEVKRIIFTSSVAVYGLNKPNPTEDFQMDPFNHYGKSKCQAEQVLQKWHDKHPDWNINILRPSVIFGERNRGNVYNLLKQIVTGRFVMIGNGKNIKSMAYVGNVVAFIQYLIYQQKMFYNVFNYVDKPDLTTNELVIYVGKVLNKYIPKIHFPLWMGMTGGYCFDFLSFMSRRKLMISSVRVKKFCASTKFDATKVQCSGFKAPYSLEKGLANTLVFEFMTDASNCIISDSES